MARALFARRFEIARGRDLGAGDLQEDVALLDAVIDGERSFDDDDAFADVVERLLLGDRRRHVHHQHALERRLALDANRVARRRFRLESWRPARNISAISASLEGGRACQE